MKLKRVLAGILTGALMITGIPAAGIPAAGTVSVHAEESGDIDNTGEKEYPNIVLGREEKVKTSSVNSQAPANVGANAVKEGSDVWESSDVTSSIPQWIQIDLEHLRTAVGRIEVVFGSDMWDQGYEITTFDTETNAEHHVVKTIGNNGPNGTIAGTTENRNSETKTDTITRNTLNQKIQLRRFVRFTFKQAGSTAGKKVSLAQIRIFGEETSEIHGPSITMVAPAAGEYPQIAQVYASSAGTANYHEDIADRTTPAATFIKRGSANESWGKRMLLDGETEVNVPVAVGGTAPELTVDPYDDGVYGFSTDAQTPGTSNKFDVFGKDVKIVSFQLYLEKAPTKVLDILGKGDKFAVQIDGNRIYTYMNGEGRNRWSEENFWFANHGGVDQYLKRWLDILVVVDGAGKQRLYVDGVPGVSKENSSAIPEEHPQDKGLQPFTIGSNLANYEKPTDQTPYWQTQLPHDVSEHVFTAQDGYIARFKFYSNANYAEITNGAGTDISDASILSDAFNNGTKEGETANFTIEKLEQLVGVTTTPAGSTANAAVESEESKAKRSKVYYMITNMLQKEEPTARISLCPYSRKTVWQEYKENTWTDIPATETFPSDLTGKKFRAVTTLYADDGYVFHDNCRKTVIDNISAGAEGAVTTVNIKSGSKNRELEIMTYYGCSGETDAAIPDSVCQIEELILGADSIKTEYAENKEVNIGQAYAMIEQLCKQHQNATAEITYTTTDTEYITIADNKSPVVKLVKSNKDALGYKPAMVAVTATLKDENGDTIQNKETKKDVVLTKKVQINIDDPKKADQEIDLAPTITAQSPVAGKFPQVVDIAFPEKAKHFEDIADRMNPSASLNQLTTDYIQNSNYIKVGASSNKNKRPVQPNEEWMNAWEADKTKAKEEQKYGNIIENVNGVWAFNGLGQTTGDTNKFDVFGKDIKLVSFKLYLKKWPDNPYGAEDDGATIDIYGKGNKYAMQVASSKKLIMYMQAGADRNGKTEWPQQEFTPENPQDFLNKWHNIFMVVDGKGWQRLYVDGKRSSTRGGESNQGGAFAAEATGDNRKPFTLGYNSMSNHPSWYDGIFTNDMGYIADFEFYSDKNYDHIINGAGTDISEAQTLKKEFADIIDLQALETKYAKNPDDIGTILTNLLQETNATANITASPYVAKTNWSQKKDDGTFENLDKINAKAFGYSSSYRSVTTLTAYDGFKFKSDKAFTDSVAENFHTQGGSQADEITVTVGPNAKGEENKVLTITAVYGKTAEAPCTCAVESITAPAPVNITIAAGQENGTATLGETKVTDVKLADCEKTGHPVALGDQARIDISYDDLSEEASKVIDFNKETRSITAKKGGTAKIVLRAKYQIKDGENWVTVTNEEDPAKPAEMTIEITVTVTREDAASDTELDGLSTEAANAKQDYPDSIKDDYEQAAWDELQAAITAAEELAADSADATSAAVAAAKQRIADAIANLADHKSAKGKAKDALKGVLDSMKAEYDANNSDKKYTDASWKAFTDAYKAAMDELATADAARLGALKTALETAKKNLVAAGGPGTPGTPGTEVKDGQVLTGPDGTYQVASAKDKTVVITKGKDAKNLKVQSAVTINKVTYKVIGIGSKAFANCKKARKITIGDNVTSIGANAFSGCSKATQLTLGKSVKSIGKKAFYNCKKLKKVTIKGKALSTIGKQAFQKTAKKVTVKWPKGLKAKQKNNLKKKLKKAKMKVK